MIPRQPAEPSAHDTPAATLPARLLLWWRGALTRLFSGSGQTARQVVEAPIAAIAAGRRIADEGAFTDLRSPGLPWLGVMAVAVGAGGGVALASPGLDRRAAALAGLASLMWAAIRWALLRLSAKTSYAEDPAGLRGAYALGLLCYALALTPELRLAAWAASAALTGYALARISGERRDWLRGIGVAWGAHALVAVGGWLARNLLLAFFATRG